MTSTKVLKTRGRKKLLAAAIPMILAAQAQGVEFFYGDLEGKLDSQLTLGSSWSMEDASPDLTAGIVGTAANSANNNDGKLNFEKGDAFSQVFKGSHDLELTYQNFGAFVRGKYWYDSAMADGTDANGNDFDDSGFSEYGTYSGAQILDAFVYGSFDIGEMPLDVRLGKQVLSWGESTFIQGGINQTNPFDVSAFRRPGAEIKEGLIPVNMAYASLGLTEALSVEAFYQLEYQETVIDSCGTFFSTNDYAPEGCNLVLTPAGNVPRDAEEDGIFRPDADGQFGTAFRYFSEELDTEFGLYAMNIHSRVPVVSGRLAMFDERTIYSTGLLDASIQGQANLLTSGDGADSSVYDQLVGAQATHDAALLAAGGDTTDATYMATADATLEARTTLSTVNAGAAIGVMAGVNTLTGEALPFGVQAMSYAIDYPEDQQIMGLSFATNVAGIALSGELTHKLDVPFQLNASSLLGSGLQAQPTYEYFYDLAGGNASNDLTVQANAIALARSQVFDMHGDAGIRVIDAADGTIVDGYYEYDVTQAQVTAIKLFDQVLGASRYALIAEAGVTYVHDFNDKELNVKFGGNTAGEDIVTEVSSGYRVRISGDYSDVFAGVNLSPVLSWSHDVDGVAPQPGGNFIEGNKVLGLALNADYRNIYNASISYTQYSGGITNSLTDRDFASINLGMQF